MKALLPLIPLVGVLSSGSAASAQQSGTAADARALLTKGVAAVKADKAGALAKFDEPNGGFKDRDLYVFCFDSTSGIFLAGPLKGKDVKTAKVRHRLPDVARDGNRDQIDANHSAACCRP